MKIQLALDRMAIEDCIQLVETTEKYIQWIEVGTGVIKEYGMAAVRELSTRFQGKTIVADMKTCDAGKHESMQAFESGATITTVMGFAPNATIKQCLEVATEYGGEVMIDLLGVETANRVKKIYELGARLFCLHVGKDMQQNGELVSSSLFKLVEGLEGIRIAAAGGITEKTVSDLLVAGVEILIVGSFITGSTEPEANAKLFSDVIKETII
ncbi:orotidine 5'-phosphate decarboxylase [Lysinibacillus agricola]|uniref:3-hexulose-6-phosphate synthase n=1 Tax=Lysinibacillus agricola TaxID=2590012 RepID=A0ABX7AYD9_9BACI|nr:Fe-S cluster assembly protein HesB [Lysinibacillus sp. FJAT-14222]QQP14804.1 orotidine 5'-phosphate decarboxylase [Lysinibacillus agricola]